MDLYSQEIKKKKKDIQNQPQTIKKMAIGTYISIITLHVNGLSASTKRHRLAKWIQKLDPYICCLQEFHFRPQDTHRLKVRGWKNIFHTKEKQRKAGVAILISDKIDLKIKITRDKEGNYIMIKGSIQEEDIKIVNIYAPNIGAPQYIRQTLRDIKGEIDSNTKTVGDINTSLTLTDKSSKQKMTKATDAIFSILQHQEQVHWFNSLFITNFNLLKKEDDGAESEAEANTSLTSSLARL